MIPRRIISIKEASILDRKAEVILGVDSSLLMENAGRSIAEEALKLLRPKVQAAVFCGKGNNAGDGFVAARHLLAKGIKVKVFLAAKKSGLKGIARDNYKILLRLKQKIRILDERRLKNLAKEIRHYGLVIDALLGIGLKGAPRGLIGKVIIILNNSGKPVISIDVPSGLNADHGKAEGACIKAKRTITFIALKKGMLKKEAKKYCGKIIVRDLGVSL